MADKITLEFDDKTKAGFDSLKKNIEGTASSAQQAETKISALNKELESRAAQKLGEEMKELADQADGTADSMQQLADKYGITQKQAAALNKEMQSRADSHAAADAKDLADELDHLAKSADTAAARTRELKKEMRSRADAEMKKDVKSQADKLDSQNKYRKMGVVGKAGAAAKGVGAKLGKGVGLIGSGAANTKAGLDMVFQGAQKVGQAIQAMSDRGVPAFEKLVGVGKKFETSLINIAESNQVQEMIEGLATAAEEELLPAFKEVTSWSGWAFKGTQNWISGASVGVQKMANSLDLLSDMYIESLEEEGKAEEAAAAKRKEVREKENAERRADLKKLKEEREAALRDPGKKMNADEKFASGVEGNTSTELGGRINKTKSDMAAQEAIFRKNNPDKDLTQDPKWLKMQEQLTQMEARMMELKRMAREAEAAKNTQGNAQENLDARQADLKRDGKMSGGDEGVTKARGDRDNADKDVLDNLVGKDKSAETDRQITRDKQEVDAYNAQIKARKDMLNATGQNVMADGQLNETIRERNQLEEKLNDKLRDREKLEKQLRKEQGDRGETSDKSEDFEGDAHAREVAASQRERADATDAKDAAKKDAEDAAKLAAQQAKDKAAQVPPAAPAPAAGQGMPQVPQSPPQGMGMQMPELPQMPQSGGMPQFPGMPAGGMPGLQLPHFDQGGDDGGMGDDDGGMGMMISPKQAAKNQAKQAAIKKQGDDDIAAYRKNLAESEARKVKENPAFSRNKSQQKQFDQLNKASEIRIRQSAPARMRVNQGREKAKALAEKRKAKADAAEQKKRNPFSEKGKKEKQERLDAADKDKSDEDAETEKARQRIRGDDSDDKKPMTMSPGDVADAKEKQIETLDRKNKDLPVAKDNVADKKVLEDQIAKLKREVKDLRKREDDRDKSDDKKEEKTAFPGDEAPDEAKPKTDEAKEQREKEQTQAKPMDTGTPVGKPADTGAAADAPPSGEDVADAIGKANDAAGGAAGFSKKVTDGIKKLTDTVTNLQDTQQALSDQINDAMNQLDDSQNRASSAGSRARASGSAK
jgi:hypothetical protein